MTDAALPDDDGLSPEAVASWLRAHPRFLADNPELYRRMAPPARVHGEVLVASVRGPAHVITAAKLGADVATMPPSVLRSLYNHPLTDKGLASFAADWAKTGQHIVEKEAAGSKQPAHA